MEIRCQANGCNVIMFEIQRGVIIIRATHHGHIHTCAYSLLDLLKAELGEDAYIQLTTEMLKCIS